MHSLIWSKAFSQETSENSMERQLGSHSRSTKQMLSDVKRLNNTTHKRIPRQTKSNLIHFLLILIKSIEIGSVKFHMENLSVNFIKYMAC